MPSIAGMLSRVDTRTQSTRKITASTASSGQSTLVSWTLTTLTEIGITTTLLTYKRSVQTVTGSRHI